MSKEQELVYKIVENWGNAACGIQVMESWLKDYAEAFSLEKTMKAWEQQGTISFRQIVSSNPFIEIPGMMFDAVEQETTGKHPDRCELMEIVVKIDRTKIEGYSETIPATEFKEDRKIWTRVHMQSGTEYLVNMPLAEFEKLLKQLP